jgi:antitoxin VapB
MGLNIKNSEVERLAAELAALTGETKTEAIRLALLQRSQRLGMPTAKTRWGTVREELATRVWCRIPDEVRKHGLTKSAQDEAVGYGPEGF